MRKQPFLLFLLVWLAVAALASGAVASHPAATVDWDPDLDELGVTWTPAVDCSSGCWRLARANLLSPDEGGGNHHVFVKLYTGGQQTPDLPFHVAWEGGNDRALTKPVPEWGDIPLWQCYLPDQGPGPYRAYAGDSEQASDVVRGLGLPVCFHYSFELEWEWEEGQFCETCTPRAWLPVVRR